MDLGGPAAGDGGGRGVEGGVAPVVEGHRLEALPRLLHERTAADFVVREEPGTALAGGLWVAAEVPRALRKDLVAVRAISSGFLEVSMRDQ